MSNLKEQILARIDETPHRAPTITAFIYATSALFHTLQRELASMIDARLIDTEQGDSGLTYIRRKAPYVEPVRPTSPSTTEGGLGFFPSRKSKVLVSKEADYIARRALAKQAAIA